MKASLAIAGGSGILAAIAAVFVGYRRAAAVEQATTDAVASGGEIEVRITGYWPFTAKASEQKMEGGVNDRKGKPLHTVEDFLSGKSDHVSISGDDAAWPYGQKVFIPWLDGKTLVGRVTDTGRNFRGSTKVYRALGKEPFDVCVASKDTKVPSPPFVVATIVKGDTLDKAGKTVDVSKFQGQNVVVGGLHMLGALAPLVDCVERGRAFEQARSNGRPMKGWSQARPDLIGPAITPFADEAQAWKKGRSVSALHMMGCV